VDFKFYISSVDIVKSTNPSSNKNFKIKGLASTPTKDKEGDVLEQNFDLSEFKWINYEHGKNPSEVIGEITKARVTKRGLEIEGELYADNELAKEVYNLAVNMQKAGNGNKLGLSVEGRTIERDSKDKSKVKKAQLFAVAVCKTPMNGDTFLDITKSLKQHNQNKNSKNMEGTSQYTDEEIQKAYAHLSNKEGDLEKGYKKGMAKEAETSLEEDDDEEDIDMPEEEIKKAIGFIKDMKARGRSNEQITKAFNNSYAKNGVEYSETQVNKLLGKGGDIEKQEKAQDIVKGYIDTKFGAMGSIFKSFEQTQTTLLKKIESLESQIDAFGHKAGLGKSEEFAKSLQTKGSPMDGASSKTLDIRNPKHKKIAEELLEKHVSIDSASSLESVNYVSTIDREAFKKAVGIEIIG
jgi:hypothetical protein